MQSHSQHPSQTPLSYLTLMEHDGSFLDPSLQTPYSDNVSPPFGQAAIIDPSPVPTWNCWYLGYDQFGTATADAGAGASHFPLHSAAAAMSDPSSFSPPASSTPAHHLSPAAAALPAMMLSPSPEPASLSEHFHTMYMPPTPSYGAMEDPVCFGMTAAAVPMTGYGAADVGMVPAVAPPSPPASVASHPDMSTGGRRRTVYECPTCNKQFTRPYNLKSHQRTHNNDRPFPCDHQGCTWKFARPHDLKRHQLLHSGHKPHECEHCRRRFARRDALRRHWKVDKQCGEAEERLATIRPYRRRRGGKRST